MTQQVASDSTHRHYAEAATTRATALQNSATSARALGDAALAKKDWKLAIEHFSRAISHDSSDFDAHAKRSEGGAIRAAGPIEGRFM